MKECDCPGKTVLIKGDALNIAREWWCPKHGYSNSCYLCDFKATTTELCSAHHYQMLDARLNNKLGFLP